MLGIITMRLVQSLAVMLVVALIAFGLFRYVGDPISNLVGQDTNLEERTALAERLGLNDPFVVQFGRFVTKAAQGDFGVSYRHRQPVEKLIIERLPATLELSLVAAALAILLAIPMGVFEKMKGVKK